MPRLKKFEDYLISFSKDPSTFEKRVAITSQSETIEAFEWVRSPFDLDHGFSTPTIVWDNFNFKKNLLNESKTFFFNSTGFPTTEEVFETLGESGFIPRAVSDRASVKKMKFPIIGLNGEEKEDFKTYGKFKKSEKKFSKFRESVIPRTRFDVISFKKEPIHIQERINGIGFDSDLSRFKYLKEVREITSKLYEKYPIDFYHISVLEKDDRLYLESASTSFNLTPSQSYQMYVKAYESYYELRLPTWFKNQVFESQVKPFYQKRYYDWLLLKPKHSIDFKKHKPE